MAPTSSPLLEAELKNILTQNIFTFLAFIVDSFSPDSLSIFPNFEINNLWEIKKNIELKTIYRIRLLPRWAIVLHINWFWTLLLATNIHIHKILNMTTYLRVHLGYTMTHNYQQKEWRKCIGHTEISTQRWELYPEYQRSNWWNLIKSNSSITCPLL